MLGLIFYSIIALVLIAVFLFIIQCLPLYMIAKKQNYQPSVLAFIPMINSIVMHDIGLGKNKRNYFFIWLIGLLVSQFLTYPIYYGSIFQSLEYMIIPIIVIICSIYGIYFTYKFLYTVTNSMNVSILGCIPMLNIIILWYVALTYPKDNYIDI